MCVCGSVCVWEHVCVSICACAWEHVYMCVHVSMRTCVSMCMCLCVFARMCAYCVCAWLQSCVCGNTLSAVRRLLSAGRRRGGARAFIRCRRASSSGVSWARALRVAPVPRAALGRGLRCRPPGAQARCCAVAPAGERQPGAAAHRGFTGSPFACPQPMLVHTAVCVSSSS